jgi:hypothetical protein
LNNNYFEYPIIKKIISLAMAYDRGNYYSQRCDVRIWDPKNPEKGFSIRNVLIENCLARNDTTNSQTINVDCPAGLLMKLLQMMRLTGMVEIKESRGEKTTICVTASDYTRDIYISAIKIIIEDSYYPKLSKSNAESLISRLNLSSLVYCVESDHSGCLVVLQQVNIYAYLSNYNEQPCVLFRRMVS